MSFLREEVELGGAFQFQICSTSFFERSISTSLIYITSLYILSSYFQSLSRDVTYETYFGTI